LIELASEPQEKLREFYATDELLRAYPTHGLFQLHSPEMGAPWKARRVDFTAGGFRYDCEGWGLIQLYLESAAKESSLSSCHTNHNSATRAANWEPTVGDRLGAAARWDFSATTRMSSRLNRFIKKLAVAKRGSRPILPQAQAALVAGKIVLV
jgi:hypothetical protein